MALIDMVMPKMGESIMECTVIAWLKQPGDRIELDESVLEVATDKVDTEVPAPYNGILKEVLVNDGDVVRVGAPIARIETEETVSSPIDSQPGRVPPANQASKANTDQVDADETPVGIGDVANLPANKSTATTPEPALVDSTGFTEDVTVRESARELETSILAMSSRSAPMDVTTGIAPSYQDRDKAVAATGLADSTTLFADRFYSPLVLNIAKQEGISRDELDRIAGSGAGNRVTKKDMLAYVIDRAESRLQPSVMNPKVEELQPSSISTQPVQLPNPPLGSL
jgi:2-oxoglutarate dehydrogenase E2 component (dihydrolipoamide succinyltransferase)